MKFNILVTKQVWTQDDLEAGEPSESYVDDEIELTFTELVQLWRDHFIEASVYPLQAPFWVEAGDTNLRTGTETITSWHLQTMKHVQHVSRAWRYWTKAYLAAKGKSNPVVVSY